MNSLDEVPLAPHDLCLNKDVSCQTAAVCANRQDPTSRSKPAVSSLRPALLCLVSLTMLAFGHVLHAQDGAAADRELVVATKAAPPFAIKQSDGTWGGISIALWKRIADREHLRFRLVETQSVPDLLDGVANGTFDAGVAAVTVTAARARNVDFTQPFLQHRAWNSGADQ